MSLPPSLATVEGAVKQKFALLKSIFEKVDSFQDVARKNRTLDTITPILRECRSLIQEFEAEIKHLQASSPNEVFRLFQERKSVLVKELNNCIVLRKEYGRAIAEGRKVHLSPDGLHAQVEEDHRFTSGMTNAELVSEGHSLMSQSDASLQRTKKTLENTINIGAEAASTLKAQTDQMERIVDNLDTLQFSLVKASKLVRAIGRQVATDKCILVMMALVIMGVVAIIIVKITQHSSKGAPPPSPS